VTFPTQPLTHASDIGIPTGALSTEPRTQWGVQIVHHFPAAFPVGGGAGPNPDTTL